MALSLAAGGYNPGDRAVSGGLIEDGAGAASSAATGGTPLVGALAGGGVGSLAGAATSPGVVNLGRPVWR